MRKKHFLLSLLLLLVGAVSVGAQTWTPTSRSTTFDAEKYYLIFNTSTSQGDYFIYENGSDRMQGTAMKPGVFTAYTSRHLFKILPQTDGNYYIQAYNGKYVKGISANNADPVAFTIAEYTNSTINSFCDQSSYNENDNSASTANADITSANKVYYVSQVGATDNDQYWNGNPGAFTTWNTAHPYAFYEVPEDVVTKILGHVNYNALVEAIATYGEGFAVGCDAGGYYSASIIEEARGYIATAQGVIDSNAGEEAYAQALVALNEAMAPVLLKEKNPYTSGTYMIVNGIDDFLTGQGVEKGIYASDENTFAWKSLNEDDYKFYWDVQVQNGNIVTMRNLATNTYLTNVGSGVGKLGTTATEIKLSPIGNDENSAGEYNIFAPLTAWYPLHANNHGSGEGVASNIIEYTAGANSASAWVLVPVDETSLNALNANKVNREILATTEGAALLSQYNNYQASFATTLLEDKIITSTEQITCNATYSGNDGTVDGLIDGVLSGGGSTWYYHTAYPDDAVKPYHYIQVNLNDNPAGDFVFYTHYRNGNNRPKSITVSGSTDGINFTRITVVEPDLTNPEYLSPIIAGGNYTHLRFTVNSTNTGSHFFTYGEFNIVRVPAEDGDKKDIINIVNGVRTAQTAEDVAATQLTIEDFLNPILAEPLYAGERVTTLEAGKKYLVYNTVMVPGYSQDRTGFIRSTGAGLGLDKARPSALELTRNSGYVWTVNPLGDGTYNLVAMNGSFVDANGSHNESNVLAIGEYSAFTGEHAGAECFSLLEDEYTQVAVPSITSEHKVWAISNVEKNNCWNGNTDSWDRWGSAHPYAFYEAIEAPDATTIATVAPVAGEYDALPATVTISFDNKIKSVTSVSLSSVDVASHVTKKAKEIVIDLSSLSPLKENVLSYEVVDQFGRTVTGSVTYALTNDAYLALLADAITDAQAVLDIRGVGYPMTTSAAYGALDEAIGTAEAVVTAVGTEIATLEAAVAAYKGATEGIQMPEDGKAYVISSVQPGETDFYFIINANNALELTETKPTSNAGFFICREVGDKYVFVNANGGYLKYKGSNAAEGWSGTYSDGYNGCAFYIHSTNSLDHGKSFGTVAVIGQLDASNYSPFTVNNIKEFNHYTRAIDNQHIAIADGWSTVQRIEEVTTYPATTVNLTAAIAEVGYVATYSAKYPAVLPTGVTAYYATDNFTESEVTTVEMTPLATAGEAIPANQGVVLVSSESAEGVKMLPATTETIAVFAEGKATNYLGNSAGAAKNITENLAAGETAYILANSTNGVGFYALNADAGATIGMNKSYLVLPATPGAVRLKFGGNTTGIDAVENGELTNAPVYDLSGRVVANPAKSGVYIKNGKKYIVK